MFTNFLHTGKMVGVLCAMSGCVMIAITLAFVARNVHQSYDIVTTGNRLHRRATGSGDKKVEYGPGQASGVSKKDESTPVTTAEL